MIVKKMQEIELYWSLIPAKINYVVVDPSADTAPVLLGFTGKPIVNTAPSAKYAWVFGDEDPVKLGVLPQLDPHRWQNYVFERGKPMRDAHVRSNAHYKSMVIEPALVQEQIMNTPNIPIYALFCMAGAIKYIMRAGRKGDWVEDLCKARNYIHRAIEGEWLDD